MSKKDNFIAEVQKFIDDGVITFSDDAKTYFEALKTVVEKEAPTFTENGKLVLNYMKANKEICNNLFKAKDIGEGLTISSRTASGALRKLVNDGYVEKLGESPVVYSLTEKGVNANTNVE